MVCPIDISSLKKEDFKCGDCKICFEKNGNNVGHFKDDLNDAEKFEEELKKFIIAQTNLTFQKLDKHKNADLTFYKRGQLICRIEAKLLKGMAACYMKDKIKLEGKETLVVDEPKFEHYLKTEEEDRKTNFGFVIPTFVAFRFDRPCKDFGGITIFQDLLKLKESIDNHPERKFERKTNENDIKNGKKLGVTRKIHFSISETLPIWNLVPEIFKTISKYESILDDIISLIQDIQLKANIKEDIDLEQVKTDLTMLIQLYGADRLINTFCGIYKSLKKEDKKYFLFSVLLNKTKIHSRVKEFSSSPS